MHRDQRRNGVAFDGQALRRDGGGGRGLGHRRGGGGRRREQTNQEGRRQDGRDAETGHPQAPGRSAVPPHQTKWPRRVTHQALTPPTSAPSTQ